MDTQDKEKPTVKIHVREDFGMYLVGEAYGHPRFNDGEVVRTSLVLRREGNTVETLNTIYELLPDEAVGVERG